MKYMVLLLKKIVVAICALYAVNLIVSNAGIVIPINVPSIIFVTILGLPALIGLFIMQKML